MNKKILTTLGALSASIIPITAVIACGQTQEKNASSKTDQHKDKIEIQIKQRIAEAKKQEAKEKEEDTINAFYQDVKSDMPINSEIEFTTFGDPNWDNSIDLEEYGKDFPQKLDSNSSFIRDRYQYRYPNNWHALGDTEQYIWKIQSLATKSIKTQDETQFFNVDEAVDFINNAKSNEYANVLNWLDKDKKITEAVKKLNDQLDKDISAKAIDDIIITNLEAAKKVSGELELKVTLSSEIFTNKDLNLNTTPNIDFSYSIDADHFLHTSFKNLLNDAVKAQETLNNLNLKLNLDDIDLSIYDNIGKYANHLETNIDHLLYDNKVQGNTDVWPVWKKTVSLEDTLKRINDMNDFSLDLSKLTDEVKNYQVIGTQLYWPSFSASIEPEYNNIKLYIQNNTDPIQYYSLNIPFFVDSKFYIRIGLYDPGFTRPNFIVKDKLMWKIFEKAYFDLKPLTNSEIVKLNDFVNDPQFVRRLQEDLKNSSDKYDNLEVITISIFDEENQTTKELRVELLDNPHTYKKGQDISWKNDFEPFLLDSSLTRKIS